MPTPKINSLCFFKGAIQLEEALQLLIGLRLNLRMCMSQNVDIRPYIQKYDTEHSIQTVQHKSLYDISHYSDSL